VDRENGEESLTRTWKVILRKAKTCGNAMAAYVIIPPKTQNHFTFQLYSHDKHIF
jgi:hypothetical protein